MLVKDGFESMNSCIVQSRYTYTPEAERTAQSVFHYNIHHYYYTRRLLTGLTRYIERQKSNNSRAAAAVGAQEGKSSLKMSVYFFYTLPHQTHNSIKTLYAKKVKSCLYPSHLCM